MSSLLSIVPQGKGGLGHRERRRSSVRLAGAAARFDAVPARAHAAGGVRMRFRHRAARVEHQQAPALRAHQASRSHRTVIGRCGFAFAWRGTCKFIECHVSWPLSSVAALLKALYRRAALRRVPARALLSS